MKIVLAGGTGFIGRALTKALTDGGDAVVLLTRRPEAVKGRLRLALRQGSGSGRIHRPSPWRPTNAVARGEVRGMSRHQQGQHLANLDPTTHPIIARHFFGCEPFI